MIFFALFLFGKMLFLKFLLSKIESRIFFLMNTESALIHVSKRFKCSIFLTPEIISCLLVLAISKLGMMSLQLRVPFGSNRTTVCAAREYKAGQNEKNPSRRRPFTFEIVEVLLLCYFSGRLGSDHVIFPCFARYERRR